MRLLFLLSLLLVCALPLAQAQCYTTYRDLGKEAAAKGRYDEAIKQYDKALECASDKPANADTEIKNLKSEARRKKAEATRQREEQQRLQRETEEAHRAEQQRNKADDDAWDIAKSAKSDAACQKYLDKYPTGHHIVDAQQCVKDYGDADSDGVANINDQCPNLHGTVADKGCPEAPIPEMVFIKGGVFSMGNSDKEADEEEKPVHTVNIKDFYLGKYEVTNREYCAFLNEKGNQTEGGQVWIDLKGQWEGEKCRISQTGNTFSVEKGYENYPIIYVSWYGAKAYAKWLSAKTSKKYRLPTEAEWEYAAGNGQKRTKYSWGNTPPSGKQGGNVYDETAKKKSTFSFESEFEGYSDGYVYSAPVGSFNANDFGLHDMSGNVWEWCEDWWHDNYKNAPNDGSAWIVGGDQDWRVIRGGAWDHIDSAPVESWERDFYQPEFGDENLGFRLAQDK